MLDYNSFFENNNLAISMKDAEVKQLWIEFE